ncbi:GAF domain-containing protein [Cellulomonas marina]|uniref:GAF domain-containing protein n=1 Tax=Cellulomonas marina TaxID=988821 RepID=UPI000B8007A9|nr:GAF domain-containing protein [Cellulomonas marina]
MSTTTAPPTTTSTTAPTTTPATTPTRSPAPSRPDDEARLAGLVRLAALVACVPTAVVNLFVGEWQCPAFAAGFTPSDTALAESMCWTATGEDAGRTLHHVPDASLDPRFARNPWVDGRRASVRFYASVPLRSGNGRLVGTLCVFDETPGHLAPQQRAALLDLALSIGALVEHREYAAQWERLGEEADAERVLVPRG